MLTANSQTEASSQELIWGVISYVPADIAWCEWLYFTLNGYPVPVALTARATRDGFGLPQALTIFPDPDDREYANRYPQALESGRYLVVICSPHSVQGETMEGHIREFKKAGGEERIIVLVVEGEPTKGAGRHSPGPSKWLPAWLRWRLDENGCFRPAERSEPQIIDARPGRMNLDDIMASLLAALLDMPRSEFEVASGPEPLPPSRQESHFHDQEGMVEQIWAELAAPVGASPAAVTPAPAPAPHGAETAVAIQSEKHGKMWQTILGVSIVGVAALGLGAVVGWLMSPGLEARGEHARLALARSQPQKEDGKVTFRTADAPAQVASAAEPNTEPALSPAAEVKPAAPASLAVSPAPATSVPSTGIPASAPLATAPISTPPASVSTSAPPQISAPPAGFVSAQTTGNRPSEPPSVTPPAGITSPDAPVTLSPEEITEQAATALLKEINDSRVRADHLLRSGQIQDALPLYLKALNSTERYTALRPTDSSAELDMAKLCLIVGSLQANYSSTAEARQTFEAGRRVLSKSKSKGNDDRSRTLASIQLQIRKLAEDAPRRQAERD